MPKTKHSEYGEPKDREFKLRLTQTAASMVMDQAKRTDISYSEVVERAIRNLLASGVDLKESGESSAN